MTMSCNQKITDCIHYVQMRRELCKCVSRTSLVGSLAHCLLGLLPLCYPSSPGAVLVLTSRNSGPWDLVSFALCSHFPSAPEILPPGPAGLFLWSKLDSLGGLDLLL